MEPILSNPYWWFASPWRWIILCLSLTGCAALPPAPSPADDKSPEATCLKFYRVLDQTMEIQRTLDVRHTRIPGLPFLRTSRFWASFSPASMTPVAYRTWLTHQNALAIEGLTLEWLRLTSSQQRDLLTLLPDHQENIAATLVHCGAQLVEEQAVQPTLASFDVPDHYQGWKRWLGLYPLAALPFYRGVLEEHRTLSQRQAGFTPPRFDEPETDPWHYFGQQNATLSPNDALTLLSQQPVDPLGIPLMDASTRQQLLTAFQPTIAVPASDGGLADNDRPLRLSVSKSGDLQPQLSEPTLYTDIAYGRYRDQVTVQLIYSVWFSERRPEGTMDLLAGRYNGIAWRVHLLPSGAVIGFDKMHQCGCWYQFFPAMGFRTRPSLAFGQEPFHIGQPLDPRARLTLWLEPNTHHLLGASTGSVNAAAEPFNVADYNELRALDSGSAAPTVAAFDAEGLLPGSERLERWIFWPMGIRSPGAMRVLGTHAIAFIGRRHFDDPALLDELGL